MANKIVVLDAGHGGKDPGAVYNGRQEKDDNLRMIKAIYADLEKQGVEVVLTRDSDIFVELSDRAMIAEEVMADLFLSIHRNSFNGSAKGVELWVRDKQYIPAMTEVFEEFIREPIQTNRGIKMGNYAVLYKAVMPAGLLEMGFITDPEDNRLYDANFNNYAKAIARGICAALDIPYNDKPPAKQLYKIQLGAWENKALRDDYLAKLKAAGYACFPVDYDMANIKE